MNPQQQPTRINEQEIDMRDLEEALVRVPGRPTQVKRPETNEAPKLRPQRPQSICDTVHDFTEEVAEFLEAAANARLQEAREELEDAQYRMQQAQEFHRRLCEYAHNVRLDGNGANKHQEKRG